MILSQLNFFSGPYFVIFGPLAVFVMQDKSLFSGMMWDYQRGKLFFVSFSWLSHGIRLMLKFVALRLCGLMVESIGLAGKYGHL